MVFLHKSIKEYFISKLTTCCHSITEDLNTEQKSYPCIRWGRCNDRSWCRRDTVHCAGRDYSRIRFSLPRRASCRSPVRSRIWTDRYLCCDMHRRSYRGWRSTRPRRSHIELQQNWIDNHIGSHLSHLGNLLWDKKKKTKTVVRTQLQK